ncbi:MAG: hypothetical protein IPO32_14440 [Crocinitomicaceae bacterium]|nr:hypothetical protein [Crocinitomicaceae bacterium]
MTISNKIETDVKSGISEKIGVENPFFGAEKFSKGLLTLYATCGFKSRPKEILLTGPISNWISDLKVRPKQKLFCR